MDEELLAEQRRYYDARAGEYDEWWERRGRYDLGAEGNAAWERGKAAVHRVMDTLPFGGEVLEFAGGTGYWTAYLARRARRVLVLDASAPMLELNRARLTAAGLLDRSAYDLGDLFTWEPGGRYDAAFAGYWISHIPAARLDAFFGKVATALRPGGTFVFLEGWGDRSSKWGTVHESDSVDRRTLNDGRTFRIVKREMDPGELATRLARAGFQVRFERLEGVFLLAVGIRT